MLQQLAQGQQVRQAKGAAPRRDHDEWIDWGQIGPFHRHATQLARRVVVIDAAFAPIVTTGDQREGLTRQGMEWVGDLERFRRTVP